MANLLGIDWGTTNRRVYVLSDRGELLRQHNDDAGILAVAGDFSGSLAQLLTRLEIENADIVLSGMVGSRNGWREVPYLGPEVPFDGLAPAMMEIDSTLPGVRCRVVPGFRHDDANGMPDVMRGEETQVLGALALGAPDGWFLLPGTHSKWVRVESGASGAFVREIVTFMTGELYSLLTRHGTLAALIQAHEQVPSAFSAGLAASAEGTLSHQLFICRAAVVTDTMPAAHAASYLSGLLIGGELREIRRRNGDRPHLPVQVIGSPTLAARYVEALEVTGMHPAVWQPDAVYVCALRVLGGSELLSRPAVGQDFAATLPLQQTNFDRPN